VKKLVSTDKVRENIRVRFWYGGVRKSFFPGYEESDPKLKKILTILEVDIEEKKVDITFNKYKLRPGNQLYNIAQLFNRWVNDIKKRSVSGSYYGAVYHMLVKWNLEDINKIPDLLSNQSLSADTYNRRKNILCKFLSWGCKGGIFINNPLEFTDSLRLPKKKPSKRLPMTDGEVSKFLSAILNDEFSPKFSPNPHSYYYPLFYFIFKTGVRNQEAVGLKIKYIDFKNKSIKICEVVGRKAYNEGRAVIFKPTKNEKDRFLPITEDLLPLLKIQCQGKGPEDLVFTSQEVRLLMLGIYRIGYLSLCLKVLVLEQEIYM